MCRPHLASSSRSKAPRRSPSRASTGSRSAKRPPTFARSGHPSHTRAKAFATLANTCAARRAKPARRPTRNAPMKKSRLPRAARARRHLRVRERLTGTTERPRLAVFRSLNHIYAQLIDDSAGHTLVSASDLEADLKSVRDGKRKSEVARLVGEALAKRAKEKGIGSVVFDRGGVKYHGRVKAFAEAARKAGLTF